MPLEGIEGITGALLVWNPPDSIGVVSVWVGMVLLAATWTSTACSCRFPGIGCCWLDMTHIECLLL